jgi:hypothetical protein
LERGGGEITLAENNCCSNFIPMLRTLFSIEQVRILVIIAFFIFSNSQKCLSQSKSDSYNNAVKVNINYRKTFGKNEMTFGQLAPVFIKANKRNNYHEIELNSLGARTYQEVVHYTNGTPPSNEEIKTFDFGLRYQFTLNVRKEGKIVPQLGLSFLSLYSGSKHNPQVSYAYSRKNSTFREVISVVPQVKFNCGNRTFLDLAIPLDVFNIVIASMQINNPAIPVRQQKNLESEASFNDQISEKLHVRLGFGIRF